MNRPLGNATVVKHTQCRYCEHADSFRHTQSSDFVPVALKGTENGSRGSQQAHNWNCFHSYKNISRPDNDPEAVIFLCRVVLFPGLRRMRLTGPAFVLENADGPDKNAAADKRQKPIISSVRYTYAIWRHVWWKLRDFHANFGTWMGGELKTDTTIMWNVQKLWKSIFVNFCFLFFLFFSKAYVRVKVVKKSTSTASRANALKIVFRNRYNRIAV